MEKANISRRGFLKGAIYTTALAAAPISLSASDGVKLIGDYKLTCNWIAEKLTYLHSLEFNIGQDSWQVPFYSDESDISEDMLLEMIEESYRARLELQ